MAQAGYALMMMNWSIVLSNCDINCFVLVVEVTVLCPKSIIHVSPWLSRRRGSCQLVTNLLQTC